MTSRSAISLRTASGKPSPEMLALLVRQWRWRYPMLVPPRMIPFFTSSAMPMVLAWRPFWVLWLMLAVSFLLQVLPVAAFLWVATMGVSVVRLGRWYGCLRTDDRAG